MSGNPTPLPPEPVTRERVTVAPGRAFRCAEICVIFRYAEISGWRDDSTPERPRTEAPRARRRPCRRRVPRVAWLIGPALVAGVAYLDPGNVASNMTAGAQYGYLLVWVVVLGNVMAWLIQYLSAKLGIVTGRSLPEMLGERIRNRWGRRAYWLQAELVAMATDLAEVIGGAVALNLLFGMPLLVGRPHHRHRLARAARGPVAARPAHLRVRRSSGLLAIIAIGFTVGVFVAPPDPAGVARRARAPLRGRRTRCCSRHPSSARRSCRTRSTRTGAQPATGSPRARRGARPSVPGRRRPRPSATHRIDARELRGIPTAAPAARDPLGRLDRDGHRRHREPLHPAARRREPRGRRGHRHASRAPTPRSAAALGPVVATLFAVGLLASGLASTSVGAYAGAEIMHGLLHVRVPLIARRLVTLIPAL